MNIGVAILASLPHVGEDRLDVALSAVHRHVHAAQRIPCLIVIEFRNCANRTPRTRCVTVLTGNSEIAVRTVRDSGGLRLRNSRSERKRKQQHCNQIEYAPKPEHAVPLA